MKNIFSSKSSEYLTNEMSICIDDLNHKRLSFDKVEIIEEKLLNQ